jgi:hypothetical protein
MSHQCTTFVAETWTDASRVEKLIGFVLSWRHHFQKRECRMSEEEIALRAPLTPRHVRRVIKGLLAQHRLERPVRGGGKNHVSSFIFVGFEEWAALRSSLEYRTSAQDYRTSAPAKPDICDTAIRKTGSTGKRISGGVPAPCSQNDFDERDIRLMGAAHREAAKRPDSIGRLTDEQYFEWVCEQSGITVERGLYLQKKQCTWPKDAAEFSSKRPPERAVS